MLDDRLRLVEDRDLLDLLAHYAAPAREDREAWLDRRMPDDEDTAASLTRRHGELIAFGWLEQNTGQTPELRPDAVPRCYRVTPSGLRALRDVQEGHVGVGA